MNHIWRQWTLNPRLPKSKSADNNKGGAIPLRLGETSPDGPGFAGPHVPPCYREKCAIGGKRPGYAVALALLSIDRRCWKHSRQ